MSQWLANAPPIVSYLIGIIPSIAGAILLLGALLYRPTKKIGKLTALPSMRDQPGTIPPQ
jgi:hypothetical protein